MLIETCQGKHQISKFKIKWWLKWKLDDLFGKVSSAFLFLNLPLFCKLALIEGFRLVVARADRPPDGPRADSVLYRVPGHQIEVRVRPKYRKNFSVQSESDCTEKVPSILEIFLNFCRQKNCHKIEKFLIIAIITSKCPCTKKIILTCNIKLLLIYGTFGTIGLLRYKVRPPRPLRYLNFCWSPSRYSKLWVRQKSGPTDLKRAVLLQALRVSSQFSFTVPT